MPVHKINLHLKVGRLGLETKSSAMIEIIKKYAFADDVTICI